MSSLVLPFIPDAISKRVDKCVHTIIMAHTKMSNRHKTESSTYNICYRGFRGRRWYLLEASQEDNINDTICRATFYKHSSNHYFGSVPTGSGVLLAYPTITHFQWGLLKSDPYTYTVHEKMVGYSKR